MNHDRRLCKLLESCEERGIALNESEKKFILRMPTLSYMGHIFTADGLKMGPSQIRLGNPLLGQGARSRAASSGLEHCGIAAEVDVKCHFVV